MGMGGTCPVPPFHLFVSLVRPDLQTIRVSVGRVIGQVMPSDCPAEDHMEHGRNHVTSHGSMGPRLGGYGLALQRESGVLSIRPR